MSESGKSEPRRILVIVGSNSDLPQCGAGLEVLQDSQERGIVSVMCVYTASIHRNTEALFEELKKICAAQDVDVIIAGAGWAAHLPGMIDAYLRYTLDNTHVVVVGVAFEDERNSRHTEAAKLSISEVPGTQVVYQDQAGQFVGPDGFRRACVLAAWGGLPRLQLPQSRLDKKWSIREVLSIFCR